MDAETQKSEEGQKAKADVDAKQKAYNEAVFANATEYTWAAAPGEKEEDKRVVLTSNKDGQFEITGLAYGTYYLEEKTAPEGYAKLNNNDPQLEFKVDKDSYTKGGKNAIDYEEKSGKNDAQCITNKKVTIPQTGGIGTVIFTVVGVMLMVGAAFALKRRKEDELEGLA